MEQQEDQQQSPTDRIERVNRGVRGPSTAVTTPLAKTRVREMPPERKTPLIEGEIRRRQLLVAGVGAAASLVALGGLGWASVLSSRSAQSVHNVVRGTGDQVVVTWNNATLQAISLTQMAPPLAARALAVVHTCMFDAWAAYDTYASGTQLGVRLRRPPEEQSLGNKEQTISFAAYHALVDLFPTLHSHFDQLMARMHYNVRDTFSAPDTPSGIGNMAALAVLAFRHEDGANQSGTLNPSAYSDYTDYHTVNTYKTLKNPGQWQPMAVPTSHKGLTNQVFIGAQWANVAPFALTSPTQFLSTRGPAHYPSEQYMQQAQEILQYSANLTDEQKVIAEYWSLGVMQGQPASHWSSIAQSISARDNHSLDQNVALFFVLSNALLDASIATWAAKRAYDSPYPQTVIRYLFANRQVRAWAGPGRGFQSINGTYWQPYWPEKLPLPAYPEYCAEHSSFSAAAADVLRRFTGSDRFDMSYTRLAHSSPIEPGVPDSNVVLTWKTFTQAAEQAGLSQRYSGMHFTQSDLDGRALGYEVGRQAWAKAQSYLNGQ